MLLTPGLMFVAFHAMAAGLADMAEQDGRSDRIQDQEDAIEAAQDLKQQLRALAAPFAPPEFNFRVVSPMYYNSNAKERGLEGLQRSKAIPRSRWAGAEVWRQCR